MSTNSQKNKERKAVRKKRTTKPVPESKYIGLDEKLEDVERALRSIKNPEILRK